MHSKFLCVNKIGSVQVYGLNSVKVEQGSSFTFTHDFPYIAFFYLLIYKLHEYAHENKATVEIDLFGH